MSEPLEYRWIGLVPQGTYVVRGITWRQDVLYINLVGGGVEDTFLCTKDSAGTENAELQAPESFALEREYSVQVNVSRLNDDEVRIEFVLDQRTLADYRDWVTRRQSTPAT